MSRRTFARLLAAVLVSSAPLGAFAADKQRRIFIVSSYHKGYLWSTSTQNGVNAAMLRYKYLENQQQARTLVDKDLVRSAKAIVKKEWMDTKRLNSPTDIARSTTRIMAQLRAFDPDIVLLGDDNAAKYVGAQLLDSKVPVVFWGINGLPLKYGLIDTMDVPGRNITGVWQSGYHKESLELLKKLVPGVKTFAILACDSESSRPNVKIIEQLAQNGSLPLKLVDSVVTNSLVEFKERALALSKKVDAFFVLNHDTLRDAKGEYVDMLDVGRWYLQNIRIPEVSHEDQFVVEGMLASANDSGFNQGLMAMEMAYDILEQGLSPAKMAVKTPVRGPTLVNADRAKSLNINLKDKMYAIDEVIKQSAALRPR